LHGSKRIKKSVKAGRYFVDGVILHIALTERTLLVCHEQKKRKAPHHSSYGSTDV
jgi:hypothetical protein